MIKILQDFMNNREAKHYMINTIIGYLCLIVGSIGILVGMIDPLNYLLVVNGCIRIYYEKMVYNIKSRSEDYSKEINQIKIGIKVMYIVTIAFGAIFFAWAGVLDITTVFAIICLISMYLYCDEKLENIKLIHLYLERDELKKRVMMEYNLSEEELNRELDNYLNNINKLV